MTDVTAVRQRDCPGVAPLEFDVELAVAGLDDL